MTAMQSTKPISATNNRLVNRHGFQTFIYRPPASQVLKARQRQHVHSVGGAIGQFKCSVPVLYMDFQVGFERYPDH